MKKMVRAAVAGAFATAVLAGSVVNVAVADDVKPVKWDTVIANCPDLKDLPDSTDLQAELEYYNAGAIPLKDLNKKLAACLEAPKVTPEAPEGDSYDANEDAYKDYAEYIYNRMEDAQNEAKAEAEYLDKAEAEYNRLLAEGAESAKPSAEAKQTAEATKKAIAKKATGALPKTGV